MTVSKEELREVERKIETSNRELAQAINQLTKKIGENNSQMVLLITKLDHNEEQYHRIDQNLANLSNQVSKNTLDIMELKTKQSGISNTLERLVAPILMAGLAAFFGMKE